MRRRSVAKCSAASPEAATDVASHVILSEPLPSAGST